MRGRAFCVWRDGADGGALHCAWRLAVNGVTTMARRPLRAGQVIGRLTTGGAEGSCACCARDSIARRSSRSCTASAPRPNRTAGCSRPALPCASSRRRLGRIYELRRVLAADASTSCTPGCSSPTPTRGRRRASASGAAGHVGAQLQAVRDGWLDALNRRAFRRQRRHHRQLAPGAATTSRASYGAPRRAHHRRVQRHRHGALPPAGGRAGRAGAARRHGRPPGGAEEPAALRRRGGGAARARSRRVASSSDRRRAAARRDRGGGPRRRARRRPATLAGERHDVRGAAAAKPTCSG